MNLNRSPLSTGLKGSLGIAIIFIAIMLWGFYLLYSSEPKRMKPPPEDIRQTEDVIPLTSGKELNVSSQIVRTMVVTGVIIVIILILARWYRNSFAAGRISKRLNIDILGRHYLDARHSLMVAEIAERKLLLGLTDTSINLLLELDNDSKITVDEIKANSSQFDSFSALLNRFRK